MVIAGVDEISRNLNAQVKKVGDVSKNALQKVTLDLKGKSQNLAPVFTGDLRGNADATVSKEMGRYVGAVGYDSPYAVRQHEELGFSHPRGGQAKYLEKPFRENAEKYLSAIAKDVREAHDK